MKEKNRVIWKIDGSLVLSATNHEDELRTKDLVQARRDEHPEILSPILHGIFVFLSIPDVVDNGLQF